MPQVPLGSVGEFRMFGLTLPGIEDVWDPKSQVCLPVGNALKLLLRIFEKKWVLDYKSQALLLKVSPSTLERYHRGLSVPRRHEQLQRIGDLLRCYMVLRVLYPNNPEVADRWLTRAHTRFRPNPVAFMQHCGTTEVIRHLQEQLLG
jgi:hypothetical protein